MQVPTYLLSFTTKPEHLPKQMDSQDWRRRHGPVAAWTGTFFYMLKRVLLALLLAIPAPSAAAQRPLILIVHGRGQAGRDSAQFRRDALHALETSLHHIDAQIALEPRDVKLAWYADIL